MPSVDRKRDQTMREFGAVIEDEDNWNVGRSEHWKLVAQESEVLAQDHDVSSLLVSPSVSWARVPLSFHFTTRDL